MDSIGISEVKTAADRSGRSSRGNLLRAGIQLAAQPREIDAELYLFALCKNFQSMHLDRYGIACILDADGAGRLPEAICRMMGAMLYELINDACECTHSETAERTVTVILRRRGTACLCMVSHGCGESCLCEKHGLRRARELASELNDSCLVRPMPRGLTAIMFDRNLVMEALAAQIWPHRKKQASQLDERLSTIVLE